MNGERLKKARKACGYTQVSLAKALNVSKGSVAMWETGKRNPEFETLEALLSLLNVSYDYLTGKSKETAHNTLITERKCFRHGRLKMNCMIPSANSWHWILMA